jgi:hypothetical protein
MSTVVANRSSRLSLRCLLLLVVALVSLLALAPARADRVPLPRDLQEKVNTAVDFGVVYLKEVAKFSVDGTWADPRDGGQAGHRVGYAALPALTLLECGERPDEPAIRHAADYVRAKAPELTNTYELSLAILFLDRLGTKKDEKLIQTMAMRLIVAQTITGGWGYEAPPLGAADAKSLLAVLQRMSSPKRTNSTGGKPGTRDGTGSSPETLTAAQQKVMAIAQQRYAVFQNPSKHNELAEPPKELDIGPKVGIYASTQTDNSVTQFVMLALWVVQKYDVPLERTMKLLGRRFETSQDKDTGGWNYKYAFGGNGELPQMDCCGLMGLAMSQGVGVTGLDQAARAKRANDPRIVNGLAALSKFVQRPSANYEGVAQENLYFLWSLERVGVIYNMHLLGGKDWYRWSAQNLVANQQKNGSWTKGGYAGSTPVLDTSMALLILKKADLSRVVADDVNTPMDDDLDKAVQEKIGASIAKAPPDAPPVPKEDPPPPPPPSPPPPPPPENTTTTPPASAPSVAVPPAATRPQAPTIASVAPEQRPATPAQDNSMMWAIVVLAVCAVILLGCGGLAWWYYARKRTAGDAGDEDEGPARGKKGGKGAGKKAATAAPAKANGITKSPAKANGTTTTAASVAKPAGGAKAATNAPIEVEPVDEKMKVEVVPEN